MEYHNVIETLELQGEFQKPGMVMVRPTTI